MSKREQIILSVMGLAILFGVYNFFIAPKPAAPKSAVQEKETPPSELAAKVMGELSKQALTPAQACALSREKAEWPKDPFLGKPLASTAEAPKTGPSPDIQLTYSGCIVAGNKALAIINGMEYQIGEELQGGGYTVVSIDPDKVVLQPSGKKGAIIVPFVE